MDRRQEIFNLFGERIKCALEQAVDDFDALQEIYIKVGQPVMLLMNEAERYLMEGGKMAGKLGKDVLIAMEKDVMTVLEYACRFSVYAHTNELNQGYITVKGGHRIGVAGTMTSGENGQLVMKYISFLNIRVAHQLSGCANSLRPYLVDGARIHNTLVVSPPGFGKTTVLRDCVRQISEGFEGFAGQRVGIADERGEIAACFNGVPQNNIGHRSVVLDGCPKNRALLMLIRSMSPQVVVADEIGGQPDADAIRYALHCGCRLLCTAHGENVAELQNKPGIAELLKLGVFARIVVISREQSARKYHIFNKEMDCIDVV